MKFDDHSHKDIQVISWTSFCLDTVHSKTTAGISNDPSQPWPFMGKRPWSTMAFKLTIKNGGAI